MGMGDWLWLKPRSSPQSIHSVLLGDGKSLLSPWLMNSLWAVISAWTQASIMFLWNSGFLVHFTESKRERSEQTADYLLFIQPIRFLPTKSRIILNGRNSCTSCWLVGLEQDRSGLIPDSYLPEELGPLILSISHTVPLSPHTNAATFHDETITMAAC